MPQRRACRKGVWTAHLNAVRPGPSGSHNGCDVGLIVTRGHHHERPLHLSPRGIAAFLQVIAIDLVLAGDNAVVIGLAAAGLPRKAGRGQSWSASSAATVLASGVCGGRDRIAGDRRLAARRRHPAPMGMLEDVARTARAKRRRHRGRATGRARRTFRARLSRRRPGRS